MTDVIMWIVAIGVAGTIAYCNHRARMAEWDAFWNGREARYKRIAAEIAKQMK